MDRVSADFPSGGGHCAAWLYRPAGQATRAAPCVVMAHGFSLTRHDGLPLYADEFAAAGYAVLLFDYQHFGDSPGEPRQRFRTATQTHDWRSAIAFARERPEVDPTRIILWGFSFSGGLVAALAARDSHVSAALMLAPFLNGTRRALDTPIRTSAWLLPRAWVDRCGRHITIPVTGPVGSYAAMALPGEREGFAATVGRESPWMNEVSPGAFATAAFHRPLRYAARMRCPVWVGMGTRDISAHGPSIERLVRRAPDATLERYDSDHFEFFREGLGRRVVADQVNFLSERGMGAGARRS